MSVLGDFIFFFFFFLGESFLPPERKIIYKKVQTNWPYLEDTSARKTGFLFCVCGLKYNQSNLKFDWEQGTPGWLVISWISSNRVDLSNFLLGFILWVGGPKQINSFE